MKALELSAAFNATARNTFIIVLLKHFKAKL